MKLYDIYQKLIELKTYSRSERIGIIDAAADLILLLDDWATAKQRYTLTQASPKHYKNLIQYREAEAALLSACKGGDE